MPKKAQELTPIEVKRLVDPGFYAVGGVAGLHLQVSKTSARSWILRAKIGDKRRDIGLGGYPDVTLASARDKAREAREKISQGIDPIAERQTARSALLAQQMRNMTFEQCALEVIRKKQAEASNPKHAQQWHNTLETYAFPKIGSIAVADIELAHVLQVLRPHWETKTETMTRVRQRIEAVLAWASVHGHREGSNVATWKGNLDAILPAPSKIAKVKHHRAIDIDGMHEFIKALKQRQGMAARCLEFVVLTAVRSGEARGATWDEIDLNAKVWIIPEDRMKAGREHRVPLSEQAVALLKALPHHAGSDLVFTAPQGGRLSDAAMGNVLKRMSVDATVHGMRSVFRDWTAERTSTPNTIAEMALAHTVQGVEGAYRRGDLLAKRAKLMQDWARFIDSKPAAGEVTPIRQRKLIEPKS